MNCKNKHKRIIRDYRNLIGEQAKLIAQQKEMIEKLEEALKDKKKYDAIINEVDRILTKFNC
tara:strand:+ start:347 stop:532 length:186 start_codon:yes stop_codon:yes gene_type:complete